MNVTRLEIKGTVQKIILMSNRTKMKPHAKITAYT